MDSILIVEDNKDLQFILKNILEMEGYKIFSVGNGTRAILEVQNNPPDLMLLDMKLPGMDGMSLLNHMRVNYPDILVIMMTAYGDVKDAVNAMKLGAYDYITKPFNNEELLLTIKKAIRTESLTREVSDLRKQLDEKAKCEKVMGKSSEIVNIIKKVNLIAPTDMSVILQGKSGTGKEVIARMIHEKSNRKNKSFVAVDCGAIPATLIESELFGYEVGAFTGAVSRKIGKFEEANGGTLLLDEITNLSMDGQAKLLRALEVRKIHRIGGKKDVPVDVRIIVTSNLDFQDVVKQGNFRIDLFHRLNEFQILLPELKQRVQDIPILAKQFMKEANKELGRCVKAFSKEVLQAFSQYRWPGNIREMKYLVKRAVLMTEGSIVQMSSVTFEIEEKNEIPSYIDALEAGESFNDIVISTERDLIMKALELADGNKTNAADILKMNRKTLYRRMKNLDLL